MNTAPLIMTTRQVPPTATPMAIPLVALLLLLLSYNSGQVVLFAGMPAR
jgi:hypothetical protein